MRTRARPGEQHIGNPHGLIAIWCDERDAREIQWRFRYPDAFIREIEDAITAAYPDESDDE